MSSDVTVDSPGRINNLQIVRALAALLVAYFHTSYPLGGLHPFGQFGVHVFFVLSGFIMAGICARSPHAFFQRRLARIVPPYWLFTLCTFSVAAMLPRLMLTTQANPIQLLKSLFFIPFEKSSGVIQPTLFLGWTLNYEMFFYLVVTVALAMSRQHAGLITSALIVACIAICQPLRQLGAIPMFYSSPIMVEFLLGIGCYYFFRRCPTAGTWSPAFALAAVTALLWMIFAQGYLLGPDLFFAGDNWFFALPSAVLIFSAAMLAKGGLDVRTGWLILVGDASYMLYLVHPYVELGVGKVVGKRVPMLIPENHLVGVIFVVIVSTLFAVAVHLWVERPMLAAATRWFVPVREPHAETSSPQNRSREESSVVR